MLGGIFSIRWACFLQVDRVNIIVCEALACVNCASGWSPVEERSVEQLPDRERPAACGSALRYRCWWRPPEACRTLQERKRKKHSMGTTQSNWLISHRVTKRQSCVFNPMQCEFRSTSEQVDSKSITVNYHDHRYFSTKKHDKQCIWWTTRLFVEKRSWIFLHVMSSSISHSIVEAPMDMTLRNEGAF